MSSITVEQQMPIQTLVPQIASSSKHVIRRRSVEVLSNSQVSYSYSTNNQIEFTISSGSDFIDFQNSYLRFDTTCSLSLEGSNDPTRYLSEGGIHSVFREIRLESASGTVLERIDRYSKLYALLSQMTQSREMVDRNEFQSADSACAESYVPECALKDAFWDSSATSFATVGGVPDPDFRVVYTGVIGANGSGDPTTSMIDPTRKKVANTPPTPNPDNLTAVTVLMKPLLSLFASSQWMPLFLIRGGLRLVMVLNDPAQCLASTGSFSSTGFTGADVVLSNARFVASMVTPSEELTSMYVQKFNNEGLTYSTLGYKHFLDILTAGSGTESKQLFSNVRSARFIMQRIQVASLENATNSATDALNSYRFDSQAIGLKANLLEYQYSSGSKQFPIFRVQVDDVGAYEAYARLQQAIGVYANDMTTPRFLPHEWREENSIMGITDSIRFAIGENLSRDKSPLTGTDLQTVPLLYDLNFDAALTIGGASAQRYLHTFIGYDQLVSISSSGIIVRS